MVIALLSPMAMAQQSRHFPPSPRRPQVIGTCTVQENKVSENQGYRSELNDGMSITINKDGSSDVSANFNYDQSRSNGTTTKRLIEVVDQPAPSIAVILLSNQAPYDYEVRTDRVRVKVSVQSTPINRARATTEPQNCPSIYNIPFGGKTQDPTVFVGRASAKNGEVTTSLSWNLKLPSSQPDTSKAAEIAKFSSALVTKGKIPGTDEYKALYNPEDGACNIFIGMVMKATGTLPASLEGKPFPDVSGFLTALQNDPHWMQVPVSTNGYSRGDFHPGDVAIWMFPNHTPRDHSAVIGPNGFFNYAGSRTGSTNSRPEFSPLPNHIFRYVP